METVMLRRNELAAFLRSRRERIAPEDVGLPQGRRRRTAGLRREEVAQLAGVGVTWYTWLEQGRPIHASPQVLDAVARTLQLDPVERQHLFRLAESPAPDGAAEALPPLPAEIQTILDQLSPMPSCIMTDLFDIVAWNDAYEALFPKTPFLDPADRNSIYQCFTIPSCCQVHENTAEQRAQLVAQLRASYAKHLGDPAWTHFVRRMESVSPEFAAMWQTQDVASVRSYVKVFRHPGYPRLPMTSTSLAVQGCAGTRLVVYTPADAATLAAMREITRIGAVGSRFPCWESHAALAR